MKNVKEYLGKPMTRGNWLAVCGISTAFALAFLAFIGFGITKKEKEIEDCFDEE